VNGVRPVRPDAVNRRRQITRWEHAVTQELILHLITAIYAACNVVRLLFYVPQMPLTARKRHAYGKNRRSLAVEQ